MKKSREITLIVMFAVIIVIFRLLIGRIVGLIAIPPFGESTGYLLSIFYSIIHSLAFLTYKGKRWRLFSQALLSTLLYLLFVNPALSPIEMATVTNLFIVDVVFNTFYGIFEQKKKVLWLIIIFQVYYWITHSVWALLYFTLFFPPTFEQMMIYWFIPIMLILIPIMVIEGLIGGFTGYKIYRRVEKLLE
jgi:hypothetical protein